MSKPTTATIRMGPVTIFTLLIIVCLATLSVLALTTARASYAAAEKQNAGVQATYDVERQGQEFVAKVDAQLATARAAGQTPTAAVSALKSRFGSELTVEGTTVTSTFDSDSRELTVQLEIKSDLTYQVTEWTVVTNSDTSEQINLWSGSGSTEKR